MNDAEIASRGRMAAQEWTEVESAFSQVEAALIRALAATPVGQDAKVLKLHMAVQNLDAVRAAIQQVISAGLIAEHAISQAGLTRPN